MPKCKWISIRHHQTVLVEIFKPNVLFWSVCSYEALISFLFFLTSPLDRYFFFILTIWSFIFFWSTRWNLVSEPFLFSIVLIIRIPIAALWRNIYQLVCHLPKLLLEGLNQGDTRSSAQNKMFGYFEFDRILTSWMDFLLYSFKGKYSRFIIK
jgi:hypothetical protein